MINAEELMNVSFLTRALSPCLKSSNDMPVINETYDGIRGSTHGERNESTPPKNAVMYPISDTIVALSFQQSAVRERHFNCTLENLDK